MKKEDTVKVLRVVFVRWVILSPGVNPAGMSPSTCCAHGKQGGAEQRAIWAVSPATQEQGRTSPGNSLSSQSWVLPGHTDTASTSLVCRKGCFIKGQQIIFLEDKKEKNTLFIWLSLFYLWATDLQSSFTFTPLWICVCFTSVFSSLSFK